MADPPKQRAAQKKAPVTSDDTDVERSLALRDVMDHVVRTSKAMPRPRESRVRPGVTIVLCALLVAASAYSWIARPEHIWGPSGEAPAPMIDRANARLTLYVIAQRLEEARARSAQYPGSLEEIGERVAGVTYQRVGDTSFVLSTATSGETITLRAREDPAEFLGKSVELVSGRRQR